MRRALLFLLLATVLTAGWTLAGQDQKKAPQKEFVYRLEAVRVEMVSQGPTPEEARILEEHFEHLKALTGSGIVIFAGRTLNQDASAFGIAVFRAESEAAARQIMESDPAVRHGLMRASLFPFHVALMEGRPIP